ncbi:TetR family transcriptional regulator [Dietzia natronolimnaea]|uniref:TetR family transcriptional regulator n=1 Tax=Dietzia natronolimnaea TaxID=161920 RepID=UPI0015FD0F0F|nr:TetR/AcrR family transcriptional regulator [Dietzia natronolimnaea]
MSADRDDAGAVRSGRGPDGSHGQRRRLPPRDRMRQITSAASALFAATISEKVTVADIVSRAGVSRALFYRHYSSVDEVFQSVVDLVAQDFVDRLRLEATDDQDAELVRVLHDFLHTCQEVRLPARALLRNSRLPGTDDSVVSMVFLQAEQEIYRRVGLGEPTRLARLTVRSWLTCIEVQTLAWLDGGEEHETIDELATRLTATLRALIHVTLPTEDEGMLALSRILG